MKTTSYLEHVELLVDEGRVLIQVILRESTLLGYPEDYEWIVVQHKLGVNYGWLELVYKKVFDKLDLDIKQPDDELEIEDLSFKALVVATGVFCVCNYRHNQPHHKAITMDELDEAEGEVVSVEQKWRKLWLKKKLVEVVGGMDAFFDIWQFGTMKFRRKCLLEKERTKSQRKCWRKCRRKSLIESRFKSKSWELIIWDHGP
jgi:hypothetical protein